MAFRAGVVVLFALVCILTFATSANNNRPIIGVLTQPTSVKYHPNNIEQQYITASYIKFVEMSGARAVHIPFDAPKEELKRLFNGVNGLLYTGGMLDMKNGTQYFDNGLYLYSLALEANAKGDYFPIWGTCQGFQLFHVFAAELLDENIMMEHFDSWDISYPLVFDVANTKRSRMFGPDSGVTDAILHDFATRPLTMNFHHLGVSRETYKKYPAADAFFRILSTNKDRQGKEFISIVEAKNYPIYGVQFHPEWPLFEWDSSSDVNHSQESIRANSYFSSFFVNECRKNNHKFRTIKEDMAGNSSKAVCVACIDCLSSK
ncbi:gamma-glutamyl hydrolase [Acrasis kona]|uniref:folate gamma-glutamyl hydrolase n=1 Tax=Acrasis kona TaxID=1008807 RepID=A0AAW2YZR4_9EUKA